MNNCGIYKLVFNGTDMLYIGQSKDLSTRLFRHVKAYKENRASRKITEAIKKYGFPTLEILVECEENELDLFENEAIEIFDAVNNGFNTCYKAEDMPKPDNSGELSGLSKFSNAEITRVFNYLVDMPEYTQKHISSLTGVSEAVINSIACGARHKWLAKEYPDRYLEMLSYKGNRKTTDNRLGGSILLKSPEGVITEVSNVRKFSRENFLDQGHIGKVISGIRKSHKGWTLHAIP